MVDRRKFLKGAGVVTTLGTTGLSGCLGGGGDERQPLGDETEFLMSPTDPQEEMEGQYTPMAEYLGEELDTSVNLQYASNYSAVISALGSNSGQIGEMGPFAAALGVRSEELEIILQRHAFGSWEYASVITAPSDSDIDSVEDLEGRTIAFADRLSSSGSLYPLYMLQEAGLDIGDLPQDNSGADFDAAFSSHTAAIEQLESGTADAAATGLFAAVENQDEAAEEYFDWLKPIGKEGGIPRAPIAVSPVLTDDAQEDIKQAFLDASDEAYAGTDDYSLWFDDVREADADTYQPVVDVAQELGIESDLLDEAVE